MSRQEYNSMDAALCSIEDLEHTVLKCKEEILKELRSIKSDWIHIKDKLPEEEQDVLIYCERSSKVLCGYLTNKVWYILEDSNFPPIVASVNLWMNFPKPPK